MRKILEASEPWRFFSSSQLTFFAESVGAAMSPNFEPITNALELPANLPVEVKSQIGEIPVPVGEGTK
jgi:hypothetical protein